MRRVNSPATLTRTTFALCVGPARKPRIRWAHRNRTIQVPGVFAKVAPANGASGQSLSPTLTWGASNGAASYEYCVDTTANAACDTSWTATTIERALSGLTTGTTYTWQVRAVNGSGTTLADGGLWWSFTTQAASAGRLARSGVGIPAIDRDRERGGEPAEQLSGEVVARQQHL